MPSGWRKANSRRGSWAGSITSGSRNGNGSTGAGSSTSGGRNGKRQRRVDSITSGGRNGSGSTGCRVRVKSHETLKEERM